MKLSAFSSQPKAKSSRRAKRQELRPKHDRGSAGGAIESPLVLLRTSSADHSEKVPFWSGMRIGEPREQITQLDAYHSRPARRVLADIDRRAWRQFACEADGDAVPFGRQPDGCQWTPARICCRPCRGGLHRQRELSLSHAGSRSVDRSRVHAHISCRYLMPAQCCRGLVDGHPTWRTAKLRKVARLDVAPLNRGILHPRRAVQRLSWAWRVATVTRRHEDPAQQNPQDRCLRVPGVDSTWRYHWLRCVTSDHAARMPYVRCSCTAIRSGWRPTLLQRG